MRRRCTCGRMASSKKPCTVCGSSYSLWHCHEREHHAHLHRGNTLNAFDADKNDLGPCAIGHAHPYENFKHWDENAGHEGGPDL